MHVATWRSRGILKIFDMCFCDSHEGRRYAEWWQIALDSIVIDERDEFMRLISGVVCLTGCDGEQAESGKYSVKFAKHCARMNWGQVLQSSIIGPGSQSVRRTSE